MKSMKIYIFLIVGVIALIAAASVLTQMLMNIEVPEVKTSSSGKKPGKNAETVTAEFETTIQLDESRPTPRTKTPKVQANKEKPAESQFNPPPPTDQPGIGTASEVRGSVQLISSDKETISIEQNKRINLNDTIMTGPNSLIQITFDDGSIISQGENSSIVIDEFLYSPNEPDKNHFTMRIIKGVCRSVSGMITNLNPDRYKVKTRMATIGIRGCDLIFKSTRVKDDIYVLDLAGEKQIVIETTTNGSPVRDPAKNKDLPIDESIKKNITIEQPNQMVTLQMRTPPQHSEASRETIRRMIDMSSIVKPAKYDLIQGADGMLIDIKTGTDNSASER